MALGFGGFAAKGESLQEPLTLTRAGQPAATIILSGRPTQAAQFAAFELQWHVREISGATLPIVRENGAIPADHVKLWVGDTSRAAALGLTQQAFFKQERAVKSGTNEVVMVGKDESAFLEVTYDPDKLLGTNWPDPWAERGTLHAVYDFLRDACGVRWLSPTETGIVLPRQPTLTVRPVTAKRRPVFTFRQTPYTVNGGLNPILYHGAGVMWGPNSKGEKANGYRAWDAAAYSNLHARFSGRNLELGRFFALRLFLLRMQIGGENMTCNHSLVGYHDRFWKKNEDPQAARLFVEKRPAYFAKGYEGEPVKGMSQLCYTSRALIAQVAQDARDYYDGMTAQGIFWNPQPPTPFPIEPNDSADFCKCAECRKLIDENYGAGNYYSRGIHSDYWFAFVNAVQRELAKTHPDKAVATLAYRTHAWLPRSVTLDPRVIVHFCFSDSGLTGGVEEYENEWRLLHEWGAEAKQSGRSLYLWHYLGHVQRHVASFSSDFYCFPDFQAHTVGEQMKAFRELGYRGTFWCGTYLEPDAYVAFRMMDDVSLDVDALLDEYFSGLYGAAAAPLKAMYLEMEAIYRDLALEPQTRPRKTGMEEAWNRLGTAERMASWSLRMEEARKLAKTDHEKRNVALFDLGFWQYMKEGRAKFEPFADYYAEAGDASSNLALDGNGGSVTVDSLFSEHYRSQSLNDGEKDIHGTGKNAWASAETAEEHWIQVKFGNRETIDRIVVYWSGGSPVKAEIGKAVDVQILVGNQWEALVTHTNNPAQPKAIITLEPTECEGIRLIQKPGNGGPGRPNMMWVSEVEVYKGVEQ